MHLANEIPSDEIVHDAASRLRDAFRLKSAAASEQERADFDLILAWIMRQTEMPESYRRPTAVAR
jgi:hypothetical protein